VGECRDLGSLANGLELFSVFVFLYLNFLKHTSSRLTAISELDVAGVSKAQLVYQMLTVKLSCVQITANTCGPSLLLSPSAMPTSHSSPSN
jgi:hypothetical protein